MPYSLIALAEAYGRMGRWREAEELVDHALIHCQGYEPTGSGGRRRMERALSFLNKALTGLQEKDKDSLNSVSVKAKTLVGAAIGHRKESDQVSTHGTELITQKQRTEWTRSRGSLTRMPGADKMATEALEEARSGNSLRAQELLDQIFVSVFEFQPIPAFSNMEGALFEDDGKHRSSAEFVLEDEYDIKVSGQNLAREAKLRPDYVVERIQESLSTARNRGAEIVCLHIAAFAPALTALERIKPGIVADTWDKIQEQIQQLEDKRRAELRPEDTEDAPPAEASSTHAQEKEMIRCPNVDCGALNPVDHKFCRECGTSLSVQPQRTQTPIQAKAQDLNAGCLSILIGLVSYPVYWLIFDFFYADDAGPFALVGYFIILGIPSLVTAAIAYVVIVNWMASNR